MSYYITMIRSPLTISGDLVQNATTGDFDLIELRTSRGPPVFVISRVSTKLWSEGEYIYDDEESE